MAAPYVKFELSPADSLADSFSSPGTQYTSLFDGEALHLAGALTPPFDDESLFDQSSAGTPSAVVTTPGSTADKKMTKKRKSWGQQLPEPKTNLPPRKRAKTEDEKEQRRVERVLRNRRAAQSSRERKRQEVEALEAEKQQIEQRNHDLEMRLREAEAQNALLHQHIARITGDASVFKQLPSSASSVASLEQLQNTQSSITFSQELFSSRDSRASVASSSSIESAHTRDNLTASTVDPSSLSPTMRPIAESSIVSSSDVTQHPAVSVGGTTILETDNDRMCSQGSNDVHAHFNMAADRSSNDVGSLFSSPHVSFADSHFLAGEVLPVTDTFDLDYHHIMGDHTDYIDDFNINDFLNPDTDGAHYAAPEIKSETGLAETTALQQPSLGASLLGCDGGHDAVRV